MLLQVLFSINGNSYDITYLLAAGAILFFLQTLKFNQQNGNLKTR
jgi:hypothetical protein